MLMMLLLSCVLLLWLLAALLLLLLSLVVVVKWGGFPSPVEDSIPEGSSCLLKSSDCNEIHVSKTYYGK
jgi:hypothetical protein